MGERFNRAASIGAFTFALLPIIGAAHAATINAQAEGFAVLAGGPVSTGQSVRVDGAVGGDGVWLGKENVVGGDVLSTGEAGLDRDSRVAGRVSARRGVAVGRGSSIAGAVDAGGSVWLDRDVRSGTVRGGAGVGLSRDVRIEGDVSHAGSFWADRGATITGAVVEAGPVPEFWGGATRQRPTIDAGGPAHWSPGESEIDLTPGAYCSLSVDRESTIRLTAGDYAFSSVWLGREVRVLADTSGGPITLDVAGSFTVDREVRFEADPSLMVVRAGNSVSVGRESRLDASLHAFGDMSIDRESVIGGRVYARNSLWLDSGVEVLGAPLAGDGAAGQIPEPASGVLMTAVLAGLAMRRRAGRR